MDLLLVLIGAGLIITGLLGAFLPVLPGPPLSYAGLFMLQLTSAHPFSWGFMLFWLMVVAVLVVLDNVIPAWTTKRSGGSAYGVWGSIIGMAAGLFFPPMGILLGPLAGAFFGEMIGGKSTHHALRSAWGSFVGFLLGTLLNVIAAGMMGYYFFTNI